MITAGAKELSKKGSDFIKLESSASHRDIKGSVAEPTPRTIDQQIKDW